MTAGRRHHTTSRALPIASNLPRLLPYSRLFSIAELEISGTISRRKVHDLLVRNIPVWVHVELNLVLAEIVQTVKTLKASLDRSGTVNKSRRSRHVG